MVWGYPYFRKPPYLWWASFGSERAADWNSVWDVWTLLIPKPWNTLMFTWRGRPWKTLAPVAGQQPFHEMRLLGVTKATSEAWSSHIMRIVIGIHQHDIYIYIYIIYIYIYKNIHIYIYNYIYNVSAEPCRQQRNPPFSVMPRREENELPIAALVKDQLLSTSQRGIVAGPPCQTLT